MNNLYDIDPSLVKEILYSSSLPELRSNPIFMGFFTIVAFWMVLLGLFRWVLLKPLGKLSTFGKIEYCGTVAMVILLIVVVFSLWRVEPADPKSQPDIQEVIKPDYVATAALTPDAQCPYLPDVQHVGVDTTWTHDGCVIYDDDGGIIETITVRVLPAEPDIVKLMVNRFFNLDHGTNIPDEQRLAPVINPGPMIDSRGHALAIFTDKRVHIENTTVTLPPPKPRILFNATNDANVSIPKRWTVFISISVDNHAGDTDTARKHLYAVREHLGLT